MRAAATFGEAQTRRRFLRGIAKTAAAPWIVSAAALGRAGRPPASERVVTGYVGVGPRGMTNVREQLSCPEAQLVAVCDVWRPRREQAKRVIDSHYGNRDCAAYVDFHELLARDDIDAVGIATPDHWHTHIAIAAARAGKDVCLEKPMGVSVDEDLACRAAMRRYGRVFQYGTEARSSDVCRFACELVRNGRIGRLREIRVKSPNSRAGGATTPRAVPAELDYQRWLGPAPWRPYTGCPDRGDRWYHVYDYALGFIAGWGAHPLDLLQWAFDLRRAGVWEIEGTGRIPSRGANDAVMDWDVRIQFSSGPVMHYWAAGVEKAEPPRLAKLNNYAQLIGEDGWIAVYYRGMECEPESLRQATLGPNDERLPVSRGQERNFIECVRTRAEPVSSLDDAVTTDLVSHLCDIAIRCRRPIRWDPKTERLLDDADAARRLRRAQRPGWG